jgi:hypothetical protein
MFLAVAFLFRILILRNATAVLAKPAIARYLYYLLVEIIAIVVY